MSSLFGGVFHDYLNGPWEQVRGLLREELEQLKVRLNHDITNLSDEEDVEGRLAYHHLPIATDAPSVIGTGTNGDFHEVHLGGGLTIVNDVLSINPSQMQTAVGGPVSAEETFVPYPLVQVNSSSSSTINNNTTNVSSSSLIIETQEDRENPWPRQTYLAKPVDPLLTSWVPLSLGIEPLQLVSDGAGHEIFVTFSA